jgi:hypothetical protein
MESNKVTRLIGNWNRAVERARNWIVVDDEELLVEKN